MSDTAQRRDAVSQRTATACRYSLDNALSVLHIPCMEGEWRTATVTAPASTSQEGIMVSTSHTHRAVKSLSKDYAWTHCVSHYPEHNERPHGNIERIDTCSCGARRSSEHNGGRAVYGSWAEAGR